MKELDVLLEPFAGAGLPGITDDELGSFEALLEAQDTDLLAWFTGASEPNDPALREMVERVFAHKRSLGG